MVLGADRLETLPSVPDRSGSTTSPEEWGLCLGGLTHALPHVSLIPISVHFCYSSYLFMSHESLQNTEIRETHIVQNHTLLVHFSGDTIPLLSTVMRGRKPKPLETKRLSGNPGKRPLNGNEPPFERGIPKPPDVVRKNKLAFAEWKIVSRALEEIGMLAKVDKAALAAYCMNYARWCEAEAKVEQEGIIIEEERRLYTVIKTNPAVHASHTYQTDMKAFLSEFGLTPSARTRLTAPGIVDDDDDFERPIAGKVGG